MSKVCERMVVSLLVVVGCGFALNVQAAPSFTEKAFVPSSLLVGKESTIGVEVTNNGENVQGPVVDLEIYNQSGQRVFQGYLNTTEEFRVGDTKRFDFKWTPTAEGVYKGKLGIFTHDWGSLLAWNDDFIPNLTVESNVVPPSFSSSATVTSTLVVNVEATINAEVSNKGGAVQSPIVDFEVYDQSGRQVFQQYTQVQGEFAASSSQQFVFHWTPKNEGVYKGKMGVFSANWASLLNWNDDLLPNLKVVSTPPVGAGDVQLIKAFVTSTPVNLTQRAVLHGEFGTPNPPSRPALLDLELYDSKNQKVNQVWTDNVVIPDANLVDKTMDVPEGLPEDTYKFKVGVFGPNWSSLLHWYDDAVTFNLDQNGQYEDEIVIMKSAAADPIMVKVGQSSRLSAAFTSPNTENEVLIDLELYDDLGNRVAQQSFDNVLFPRAGTGNFQDVFVMQSPTNLRAGVYHFRVGIFTPGWGKLINWYQDAAQLTVVNN